MTSSLEETERSGDMNKTVRDWEFYFLKMDGEQNRSRVVWTFTFQFWKKEELTYEAPGRFFLGGRLFDENGAILDNDFFSTAVVKIERVKKSSTSDLLRATTEDGETYDFYSDGYNSFMFLLLRDMMQTGALNERKGFYLKRSLRGRDLL